MPDENAGFDDNERGDETEDETEEGDLNAAFDHDENDDETWHDCHDCSDANPSDSNVGFDFAERDDVISHDDFEADWDARAMAAIADSNEPFCDHSDIQTPLSPNPARRLAGYAGAARLFSGRRHSLCLLAAVAARHLLVCPRPGHPPQDGA